MDSFHGNYGSSSFYEEQQQQQQSHQAPAGHGDQGEEEFNSVVVQEGKDSHPRSAAQGAHERMPDILRLEMLSLLHTKPLTGYELRKSIKASFNHEISFGTLYPNLASLERAGLIQGQWVSLGESQLRRKRIFTLTPAGKNFLIENLTKLNKITGIMQKLSLDPIRSV